MYDILGACMLLLSVAIMLCSESFLSTSFGSFFLTLSISLLCFPMLIDDKLKREDGSGDIWSAELVFSPAEDIWGVMKRVCGKNNCCWKLQAWPSSWWDEPVLQGIPGMHVGIYHTTSRFRGHVCASSPSSWLLLVLVFFSSSRCTTFVCRSHWNPR